ncbi:alkaline phosphatase, partial [Thalassolituus alkanivorans]
MKLERLKLPVALLLSLSATAEAAPLNNSQLENAWYKDAQARLNQRLEAAQKSPNAKNVILFVGDGMGVSTLTAARILEGQKAGKSGEEGYLSFESFPYTALVKTYNVDAQTPDSAGTMTAMMSGIKTDAGVIGV